MFSDQERYDMIFYLGWPAKVLLSGSTHYQKTLNDRFLNLSEEAETIARRILKKLKKLDEKLEEAQCRFATSKVGGGANSIELNENERELLLKERKRCIRELSQTLDIPVNSMGGSVMRDVCAKRGYLFYFTFCMNDPIPIHSDK